MDSDNTCRISRVQVLLLLFFHLEKSFSLLLFCNLILCLSHVTAFWGSHHTHDLLHHLPQKTPCQEVWSGRVTLFFLDCCSFPYKNNYNSRLILALHMRSCVLAFLMPEFSCQSVSTAIMGKELAAKSPSPGAAKADPSLQGPPAGSSQLKRCLQSPALWFSRLLWGWGSCTAGWASTVVWLQGEPDCSECGLVNVLCQIRCSWMEEVQHLSGLSHSLASTNVSATTQARLLQNPLRQALQGVCG